MADGSVPTGRERMVVLLLMIAGVCVARVPDAQACFCCAISFRFAPASANPSSASTYDDDIVYPAACLEEARPFVS